MYILIILSTILFFSFNICKRY